ncbi:origin recognition complex subunit 6-domain-containing protein [Paraphoma chrysanthemicola]|uniref:Origin recognition complex subunit 6-domain-containing protein n=1 Tax=Paraphoma chrysanthemicola TaxID=798071 RepID=A0A8K0W4U9_9PLEO|nr:origin recognition complex subunit 6-domain-containing protein [Paraphoma chrysanthemicola]
MSRSSVEQALTGLVPALNGPLPPDLVELALSLLARSRSVANSLKPDEEIARPYACAQLACERSKKRFNLPTIVSRPPCPPRIYKKLYNYLSSTLPAPESTRDPQTPSKKAPSASASARTTPKTPLSGRKTPRSTRKLDDHATLVPEWVMPAIRSLLKNAKAPRAASNVFTGVESILPLLARMAAAAPDTPSKRSRRTGATSHAASSDVPDVRICGLIAVVFFYVLTKMRDTDVTPAEYDALRETAMKSLLELPVAVDFTRDELFVEVEEMLPMAQSEGWLRMEWFLNVVPDGDGDAMEGVEYAETNGRGGKGGNVVRSGGSEYIGLGTMMQDATDYLGERQREEYQMWKQGIMARVEEIEAAE